MNSDIQHNIDEIDKDLSPSWIELSSRVRELAADLKLKAAGTSIASEAAHLSQETARLCDHVNRLHNEVIDLVENIETHFPLPEHDLSADGKLTPVPIDEVTAETIRIQREHHELRADFKDILKALFLWRDDPKERIRERQ